MSTKEESSTIFMKVNEDKKFWTLDDELHNKTMIMH